MAAFDHIKDMYDVALKPPNHNWRSTIDSCVNHLMELIVNDIPDNVGREFVCWG
ncbi:unnamed protein product [Prunus armeniaca]|uniref:Uncharacterized protein n=1 Tax=Prunus armeniaca TaxID=36596 RepID=A0A6J5V5M3_PRUAR|nr:unnamed protein product [Prunus armeniaca]